MTTPTLTQVLRGQADFRDAICRAPQGFDVLPSDHDLDTAAAHIVAAGRKSYYTLRREMERLDTYDVCLFDHSPSYSSVTEACLLASKEMLIPCELSPFSVEGLLAMFDKLNDVLIDHTLTMTGIVPFKLDRRMAMHTAYINDLRQTFGDKVLPAVRTDSAVSKAQSFHQSVFDDDQTARRRRILPSWQGSLPGPWRCRYDEEYRLLQPAGPRPARGDWSAQEARFLKSLRAPDAWESGHLGRTKP